MNTKTLSDKALSVIEQYRNFKMGSASCSIPYYNNRSQGARARLRAQIGKGGPKDIFDEAESVALSEKIDIASLDEEGLKKFLTDKNIGIDCSGLVYYILSAESENRGKGPLDKHISFPFVNGMIDKLRNKLRPVENTDAATCAHPENSTAILLQEAQPGDIITMIGTMASKERDHIIVLHKVEYDDSAPIYLHYTHTVAWPTDGEYGHGVRQGIIEIKDISKPITEQVWMEADKTGEENYTFSRAQKSTTSLRRLLFL